MVHEATQLLKGLRLAAFQVEPSLDTPMFSESVLGQLASAMAKIKTGLLDGGATHALRQGTAKEISRSEKTVVNLALGSAELYLSPTGVLLSVSPVSPIAPLGALVKECGCQVTWVEDMCKVWHPKHGWLKVQMQQNTPHVDESTCLMLIKELENLRTERMMRALYVKALALGQKIPDDLDPHVRSWLDWLRQLSPEAPETLISKVPPCVLDPENHPKSFNRRIRRRVERAKGIVLNLFSGDTSGGKLGRLPHGIEVLDVELKHGADMLEDCLFQYLLQLCMSGRVRAILAGPPCRSFSPRRSDSDGGPVPVRDRDGPGRFGREGLSPQNRKLAQEDTVLIFRTFLLYKVARDGAQERGGDQDVMFVGEHPRDPREYRESGCENPSMWAWPETIEFQRVFSLHKATFNQSTWMH